MSPIRSIVMKPGFSFCRKMYGMATITRISTRIPRTMEGTIPIASKIATLTELHSMKCSSIDARYNVDAEAMVEKNTAEPMNTQYRLSKFTSRIKVQDVYVLERRQSRAFDTEFFWNHIFLKNCYFKRNVGSEHVGRIPYQLKNQ